MAYRRLRMGGLLTAMLFAGCGSAAGPSGPTSGGPPGGGNAGAGVQVTVGNVFFRSARNGSANPAVDTVAVGDTVTWTWVGTGTVPHSIQSVGETIFRNSTVESGSGSSYQVRFGRAGTYLYNCAVHGDEMSGTIVVR